MATTKAQKEKMLEDARAVLKESSNMILTEYRGINVVDMTDLRATLRKSGVKFKILKNTLLRKLSKEMGFAALESCVQGPVGIVFLGKDAAQGAKAVLKYAKQNQLLVIKAGFIDGKVLNTDSIKAVASLPSREVMLAMLLGTLQAPLKGVMTVLQGNTRKLLYALNAVKEQKQKAAA